MVGHHEILMKRRCGKSAQTLTRGCEPSTKMADSWDLVEFNSPEKAGQQNGTVVFVRNLKTKRRSFNLHVGLSSVYSASVSVVRLAELAFVHLSAVQNSNVSNSNC